MFLKRKKVSKRYTAAIIVAAGSSQRMGGENKLLLTLLDIPILAHTLLAFEECDAIDEIVLVCREQDMILYSDLAKEYEISKLNIITRGGNSRTASVLAGVRACSEQTEMVAVHDGARPLVPVEVIAEVVKAAEQNGAACPAVPIKDSIKRISNGVIIADVQRESIVSAQTPQVFEKKLLINALTTAEKEGKIYTDDCAAVESYGATVSIAQGSYENIKITTEEDLWTAEAILQRRGEK